MGDLNLYKLEKKLIVIFILLVFVTSGITTTSALTVHNNIVGDQNESSLDRTIQTKKVTLYRYGPDGSTTSIEVEINLNDEQNIGEIMADKCEELFENDEEMQNQPKLFNYSIGFVCKVKSYGKGSHYKTMLIEKLIVRFILFRLGLPRLFTILNKPLVLCKYQSDSDAKTVYNPILRPNATPVTVNGTHKVAAINFLGFTSWFGRFSFSLFDVVPRAFSGIANLVVCKKF